MIDYLISFNFLDWIGIIGSLMIAGAYYGVSNSHLVPEKLPFHLINLIGSTLILISLYFKPNPGAILIEILWIFIASLGIYNFLLKKIHHSKSIWFLRNYPIENTLVRAWRNR